MQPTLRRLKKQFQPDWCGIQARKVKSDIDLARRIGNLYKGDWEDAPSFSSAAIQGNIFVLPGEEGPHTMV